MRATRTNSRPAKNAGLITRLHLTRRYHAGLFPRVPQKTRHSIQRETRMPVRLQKHSLIAPAFDFLRVPSWHYLIYREQLAGKLLLESHATPTHLCFRVTLRFPQGYAEKSSGLPCREWVGRQLRMGCNDACAKTQLTVYSTTRRYSRIGATPMLPCYREIGRKSSEIGGPNRD